MIQQTFLSAAELPAVVRAWPSYIQAVDPIDPTNCKTLDREHRQRAVFSDPGTACWSCCFWMLTKELQPDERG